MKTNVLEKIGQMKKRYLEASPVENILQERLVNKEKKIVKIQKRLAALEMEKCQLKLDKKDLTQIEEKISRQKALYCGCCKPKD